MSTYRSRLICCLFLSSLLFVSACQKETSGQPLVPPNTTPEASNANSNAGMLLPLVPGARERTIAWLYVRALEGQHLTQKKLDASVSKEAFRLYLKSLDPLKMYFYQSDIDEFTKKYELVLCDAAKEKNVSPAFDIYNRLLDRIRERVDMIVKILDTPQDFTIDEEIITDKKLMQWSKTPEESYDRWRKRIKSDILALKAERKEKIEDREKAIAEGKTPPKAVDERDPIERLKKRYISYRKRMLLEGHIEQSTFLDDIKRQANDEVLESYLTSISGALDPHTSFMSPTTLKNFEIMMGKSLEGIGATLTSEDGYTVVKKLVPQGPADKSGQLKPDDKISGVGQGKEGKIEDVVDMKLSDVVQLIRGAKGTVVRLEIVPGDGSATRIIEIVRERVTLEDQAAKKEIFEAGSKADGTPYKIGVIDLPDFYLDMDAFRRGDPNARSTTSDIKKILKYFVEKNVDVVVLDLRLNGGGSLHEAVALTGLFINSGNVVQTKDETSSRPRQLDDTDPSCDWTGPLVVLASKFSASASEIFTGAIKDYKRGLIVGDSRTHGKGTVQQVKDLGEGLFNGNFDLGSIKLTIQGFYRPSGVSPQREGVASDVVIPSLTDVLEDICESDLDNALTFSKISEAATFPQLTPYVNPQIAKTLQQSSDKRIQNVEDFQKLQKEIAIYKEIRGRKTSTLNEKKYFEELDRLNADKREKEKFEELMENEAKIKRDYYLDEAMNIAVEYINLLQQTGTLFPKDRTVIQKKSPLNFLLGL